MLFKTDISGYPPVSKHWYDYTICILSILEKGRFFKKIFAAYAAEGRAYGPIFGNPFLFGLWPHKGGQSLENRDYVQKPTATPRAEFALPLSVLPEA